LLGGIKLWEGESADVEPIKREPVSEKVKVKAKAKTKSKGKVKNGDGVAAEANGAAAGHHSD